MDDTSPRLFDFAAHGQRAVSEYLPIQQFYSTLAAAIARIVEECLKKRDIKVQSVQNRAKEPGSLAQKAATPSETNPNLPMYAEPLRQITDLAGIRVIAYFPSTLDEIDRLLYEEFDVIEKSDKSAELIDEERFGYQSIHYLVRLKRDRTSLAEYENFADGIAEVQVRTILQHAWAEIEHDIQYKSSRVIPSEIRRRFMALAGMLEIADREFQAIQDADRALDTEAQTKVESGDLISVEITPKALKLFLDKKIGVDSRISDWSYDWTARLLKRLSFRNLKQVETAIAPYNDDQLSRLAMGARQGQTTRFELMLLAALGEKFIECHPWKAEGWFPPRSHTYLHKFADSGIKIGTYTPDSEPSASTGS